jgi:hypothetical protein
MQTLMVHQVEVVVCLDYVFLHSVPARREEHAYKTIRA